jgi:hypothetical protein
MTRNYFMRKFDEMPNMVYNHRYFIVLMLAAALLLGSCKKTVENISEKTLQQYFEETILNKNFVVQYAKDNTTDLTGNYTSDTFVMKKGSTYYSGEMTGSSAGVVYTGTWNSNEDYSKLDININTPAPPSEFSFLNRSWKFTKKSLPIMELAPWGSTDPKVLHMRRL